jgi:hypothetical protein
VEVMVVVERVAEVGTIVTCLVRGRRDKTTPGSFVDVSSIPLVFSGISPLTFVIKGKLLPISSKPGEGSFEVSQSALGQVWTFEHVIRDEAKSSKFG